MTHKAYSNKNLESIYKNREKVINLLQKVDFNKKSEKL